MNINLRCKCGYIAKTPTGLTIHQHHCQPKVKFIPKEEYKNAEGSMPKHLKVVRKDDSQSH